MGHWTFPKNTQIDNIDEVMELVSKVNSDSDSQIDFSLEHVEKITPFTMCFWSFLQDLAFRKSKKTMTTGPSGNQLVYEFGKLSSGLTDFQGFLNGFADKLGLTEITSVPIIKFDKSHKLQDQSKLRRQLLDFMKDQISLHSEIGFLIYHSLKELIDNSYSHSQSETGTYVCAKADRNMNQINICFLDSGIGIHKSLSKKYNNIFNSADAIKKSVGFLVSRYNDPDRGRGLFTLQHSLEKNAGRLTMVSGDGYYEYNAMSDGPPGSMIRTLKNYYQGTIVDVTISNKPDYRFTDDLMEEIL